MTHQLPPESEPTHWQEVAAHLVKVVDQLSAEVDLLRSQLLEARAAAELPWKSIALNHSSDLAQVNQERLRLHAELELATNARKELLRQIHSLRHNLALAHAKNLALHQQHCAMRKQALFSNHHHHPD